MKGCVRIRRMVDAYLDGQLSRRRHRCVEDHLAACSSCQRYLESCQLLREALQREAVASTADPQLDLLWPRIEASIATIGPGERARSLRERVLSFWHTGGRSLRLLPIAAAAAALLVIFLPHFRNPEWVGYEVVIEPMGRKDVTFVVSKFKETNTSIIWIVESNG